MDFNVHYNEKICGILTLVEEDMFVIFNASCDIVSLDICRIYLKNAQNNILLGVLVPKNGRYILKKKLTKAYVNKICLDNSFYAYIKNQNHKEKIEIYDKNLQKCLCERITKQEFLNFDTYSFEIEDEKPFLFDFCFTICEISQKRAIIKTDKNGKILTK